MLRPGTRLLRDGDMVEIVEFAGASVVVCNHRTRQFSKVRIGVLVAEARSVHGGPYEQVPSLAVALDGLTEQQRAALSERGGHVREVLTGYRSGHQQTAVPGEPRPEYDTSRPLKARYLAKARELGVTGRTIERWVVAYRDFGVRRRGRQMPRHPDRRDRVLRSNAARVRPHRRDQDRDAEDQGPRQGHPGGERGTASTRSGCASRPAPCAEPTPISAPNSACPTRRSAATAATTASPAGPPAGTTRRGQRLLDRSTTSHNPPSENC